MPVYTKILVLAKFQYHTNVPLGVCDRHTEMVSSSTKNGGLADSETLNIPYRPLSRRLDRCDRVIHNESGDPNGGNMCSFSGATCTSRVRHNADYVPYAKIRFDL